LAGQPKRDSFALDFQGGAQESPRVFKVQKNIRKNSFKIKKYGKYQKILPVWQDECLLFFVVEKKGERGQGIIKEFVA
jgi:hypothetical protein